MERRTERWKEGRVRGGCRGFRSWQHAERSRKQARDKWYEALAARQNRLPLVPLQRRSQSSFREEHAGAGRPGCLCSTPRERRATGSMHLHRCAAPLLLRSPAFSCVPPFHPAPFRLVCKVCSCHTLLPRSPSTSPRDLLDRVAMTLSSTRASELVTWFWV